MHVHVTTVKWRKMNSRQALLSKLFAILNKEQNSLVKILRIKIKTVEN